MSEKSEPEFEQPKNFQQAMDRLETLARELESGELPLEEAMEAYREGQELLSFCQERLEDAEMVIEEVREGQDGVRFEPGEEDS